MNSFSERYKSLSNQELFRIIHQACDYQPEAVIAAELEISARKLHPDEIGRFRRQIEAKKESAREKFESEKKKAVELRQKLVHALQYLNPVQPELPNTEKIIRFIFIGFSILFLYRMVSEFQFVIWMFTDPYSKWDASTFQFLFHLILLPVALVLFGKRTRSGWSLLAVFISYSVSFALYIFATGIGQKRTEGMEYLNDIFNMPPPGYYLLGAIIWGAILFTLMRKDIRAKFNINRGLMWIPVIAGVLTAIAFVVLLT